MKSRTIKVTRPRRFAVVLESKKVIRFDTPTEAWAFMTNNPGSYLNMAFRVGA